jgi:hypothetical protein
LSAFLQSADHAERLHLGVLALVRLGLDDHLDGLGGHVLDLGGKALPALVPVDEVPGFVPLPRIRCLNGEGGACLPFPGAIATARWSSADRKVIQALADDDRDHRVGLLGHLQPVEPDIPLALGCRARTAR